MNNQERKTSWVKQGYQKGWRYTPLKGKVPTRKSWQSEEPADLKTTLKWLDKNNIGLRTGKVSGVVILDVDEAKGGQVPDNLPETVTVLTGGGGRHFYFKPPKHITLKNWNGKLGNHIDLKTDGGQVVFPGSVHPDTGAIYEWAPGLSPDDVKLAPFPVWIVEETINETIPKQVTQYPTDRTAYHPNYVLSALQGECEKVASTPEGGRNSQLNESAFLMGTLEARGLIYPVAKEGLVNAAISAGLPEREANKTFENSWAKGVQNPREFPQDAPQSHTATHLAVYADSQQLTDLGTANKLQEQYGDYLRHSTSRGWLVWDKKRWVKSEKAAIRKAQSMGMFIRKQSGYVIDESRAKELRKHARHCESASGTKALLSQARALNGIDADDIEWDAQPWKLNCKNGCIDLATGELLDHEPSDYITKLCPVNYDPDAKAPRWLQFLDEVFDGNQELIEYIQWMCGYALTGDTSQDVFFILFGTGANGKSTFVCTLQNILGPDYAQQINPEELMLQKNARHSTEMAALEGARLVVTVETSEGRRLNEALIKSLTGGDKIRARFMRMDSFEFTPQLKLMMGTNHKPVIRDSSNGMWRRIRLIPFNQTFEGAQRDPGLAKALQMEAPGILAWAVRGAILAFHGEAEVPEIVRAETETYRDDEDLLKKFIDEHCIEIPEARCAKRNFYHAFRENYAGRCAGERAINERMKTLGYQDGRISGGHNAWFGIGLRAE